MTIHKFILQEDAEQLLPTNIRARITKETQDATVQMYNRGLWYEEDIVAKIAELMESGHFAEGKRPSSHKSMTDAMLENRKDFQWKVGDVERVEPVRTEEMYENDMLVTSGIIASDILNPDEFWNVLPGFSGPSDMHGTIGALLLQNRDLFFEYDCYTWESVEDGKKYKTRISGSKDKDLRIERICLTYKPTQDPSGASVHYQPITTYDRQRVSPLYGTEPALLAAVLKYIDQEHVDVPCLADQGRALLEEMKKDDLYEGRGDTNVRILLSNFAFPMNEANADRSIFWDMQREFGGTYRIHIDARRHFAISTVNGRGVASGTPSMTFPPEEMEQLVRGILMQSKKNRGRTTIATLEAVINGRFSPDFEKKMAAERKAVLGHE